MVQPCNPNILGVEVVKTGVQGHPWLGIKFEDSISYMRPCLTQQKGKIKEESVEEERKEGGRSIK